MALVKCPDCGKMVSERVSACPDCGCPAEYFEKENIEEEETLDLSEAVSFTLLNDSAIVYDKDDEIYAHLFGDYLHAADIAYNSLNELYKKSGNIVKALESIPSKAEDILEYVVNDTVKRLYEVGISTTPEKFYEEYCDEYDFDYEPHIRGVVKQYTEILEIQNQLAYERSVEKNSRGRWQGGGFGLKGAIKGAVTASVLNAGSDFLHSFGDSAKASKDAKLIKNELDDLYNSKSTKAALCFSVKAIIMQIFEALIDKLIERGIVSVSDLAWVSHEDANELYDSVMAYEKDSNIIADRMIECIGLYPGDIRYYKPIFEQLITEDNEFSEFINFWHINHLFEDAEKEKIAYQAYEKARVNLHMDSFNYMDYSFDNMIKVFKLMEMCYEETGVGIPKIGDFSTKIKNYLKKIGEKYAETIAQDYRILDIMVKDEPQRFLERYYSYLVLMGREYWLGKALYKNAPYKLSELVDDKSENFLMGLYDEIEREGFLLTTKRLVVLGSDNVVYKPEDVRHFDEIVRDGRLYTCIGDLNRVSYIKDGYVREITNPMIAVLYKGFGNQNLEKQREAALRVSINNEKEIEKSFTKDLIAVDAYYESLQYPKDIFNDTSFDTAIRIIKDYTTFLCLHLDRDDYDEGYKFNASAYRKKIKTYLKTLDQKIVLDENLYLCIVNAVDIRDYVFSMTDVLQSLNDYFGFYSGNQELDEYDGADKRVIKLLQTCDDDELLLFNAHSKEMFQSKGFVLTTKRFISAADKKSISLKDIREVVTVNESQIAVSTDTEKLVVQTVGTGGDYFASEIKPTIEKNTSVVMFLREIIRRITVTVAVKDTEQSNNNSEKLCSDTETKIIESQEIVNPNIFCPYCGKQILRTVKFCNFCGKQNNYSK